MTAIGSMATDYDNQHNYLCNPDWATQIEGGLRTEGANQNEGEASGLQDQNAK